MTRAPLAFIILLPALAQAQTGPLSPYAFCPPPHAKVTNPPAVPDDLCLAKPTNSYRMQSQSAPLSFQQKAAYFAENQIVSGSALFGAAFFLGVAQLRHDPSEWPLGADGFGRRIGTRYAQTLAKNTAEFVFGILEDPRPKPPPQLKIKDRNGVWVDNPKPHSHQHNSFGGRLGFALLGVIWTHYDSGRDNVAYSRVAGAVSSGLVGRLWTPDPENTWGQVGIRIGTAFAGYAGGAVFNEFQPDISKLFSKLTGQSKMPAIPKPPPKSTP